MGTLPKLVSTSHANINKVFKFTICIVDCSDELSLSKGPSRQSKVIDLYHKQLRLKGQFVISAKLKAHHLKKVCLQSCVALTSPTPRVEYVWLSCLVVSHQTCFGPFIVFVCSM